MLVKNDYVTMEITDLTQEGNGVGRAGDFAVFVPLAAVGDVLEVRIVKVLKRYAYGIIERVLSPSPDRIEQDCPAYKQCGGCQFRHISYEAELKWKERLVYENLKRIGKISLEGPSPVCHPILASPEQARYRNKAIFPVSADTDGRVRIGFYAKRSHRVVECRDCPLHPVLFGKILEEIRAFVETERLPIYNETTHKGNLRAVYLRSAFATGETMLCLVCAKEHLPKEQELASRIAQRFPAVVSILANWNPERTNVVLGKQNRVLYGKPVIADVLCGKRFEISPNAFYQVNPGATELLYGKAAEFAQLQPSEILLDLYCGIGAIGITMAQRDFLLTGVDVVRSSIENAAHNAQINGLTRARFFCLDATEGTEKLVQEGMRPQAVVVDPPRKGCSQEVLHSIAELSPGRVIYISCNSATLARDLCLLQAYGYYPTQIQPVDLFPRTGHVETCILLSHKKKYL